MFLKKKQISLKRFVPILLKSAHMQDKRIKELQKEIQKLKKQSVFTLLLG